MEPSCNFTKTRNFTSHSGNKLVWNGTNLSWLADVGQVEFCCRLGRNEGLATEAKKPSFDDDVDHVQWEGRVLRLYITDDIIYNYITNND